MRLDVEEKLKAGEMDVVVSSIEKLKDKIRTSSEREIASETVGEWVMQELKNIDEVAYVRFASVYRDFQETDDFRKFIDKNLNLKNE